MRIRRLQLANFRGVAKGTVAFLGHTVIIGGNSVGKSTMCEALDLLLGPDRLSRRSPIDEHDFFERRYLDEDGVPIPIEMEVVLTDLTDDVLTRFRTHREYWNTATSGLLDETATPEDVDGDDVVPALRIRFEGVYDVEEDEFRAETYFASPPPDDGIRRTKVSRAAKRLFGFIYLRALRTGTRALSLERGSLLDVILKLKDDDRSAMWEQTLASMEHLDPAIDAIPQLKEILDDIHTRVRRFVGLSTEDRAFRLYPSALTRESLRRSITLFGSSERSNTPVPYWRLGSGVVNSMVFSLLTFIAELKSNVIFAMEEPEIAIPPHTQRRIVQFLRTKMAQSILTTHSPFVLEQYDPARTWSCSNVEATGSLPGAASRSPASRRRATRATFAECSPKRCSGTGCSASKGSRMVRRSTPVGSPGGRQRAGNLHAARPVRRYGGAVRRRRRAAALRPVFLGDRSQDIRLLRSAEERRDQPMRSTTSSTRLGTRTDRDRVSACRRNYGRRHPPTFWRKHRSGTTIRAIR